MESERLFLWVAFNLFVLGMLAIDLGVFHRKAHAVTMKEAGIWSVVWIALAMVFNLGIYFAWGQDKALEFLTGYVIEKSLSVDNLFVFLMIFQYFATPAQYQHRVLFWGILGALILRAVFIATGSALLSNFHWMMYVFGGFLVITGVKMYLQGDEKIEPERNPVVRLFERWVPISKAYDGQKFFIRRDGRTYATLLMLVLIVVETTDVIFAVDSIPAIFAITQDPFIVYTSNVFAILGLRALYFMLAGVMEMFVYLKVGLSFVLCFVGAKMMLVDIYKIPIGASLAVIGGVLLLSIIASWLIQPEKSEARTRTSGVPSMRSAVSAFARPAMIGWLALFLFAAVLILVKWDSIARGPTSREAFTVVGIVERDLAQAKWQLAKNHDAAFAKADQTLEDAWSNLEEKRYQQAIETALQAGKLLDDLPGSNWRDR
jgi:TerC family integral membrane protein